MNAKKLSLETAHQYVARRGAGEKRSLFREAYSNWKGADLVFALGSLWK